MKSVLLLTFVSIIATPKESFAGMLGLSPTVYNVMAGVGLTPYSLEHVNKAKQDCAAEITQVKEKCFKKIERIMHKLVKCDNMVMVQAHLDTIERYAEGVKTDALTKQETFNEEATKKCDVMNREVEKLGQVITMKPDKQKMCQDAWVLIYAECKKMNTGVAAAKSKLHPVIKGYSKQKSLL